MKALVYEGPKLMVMRKEPLPTIADHEVLVKVKRAGICGSELGGYLGHNSLRKPPLIMGHEFSGVVERVGERVSNVQAGTRVTVNPLITCGKCIHCRNGKSQTCEQRQLLGAHKPGAFAEYVVAPAKNVYALAEETSFNDGTLVEPFACAVHVCRKLALLPEQKLLIYGAGPIGLLVMQVAKIHGLTEIVVVDLNEDRLEIVRELGGIGMTAIELNRQFDVAVDAVGAAVTRVNCMKAVRPNGEVIFTGLHEDESVLPINDLIRSETKISGAFAYSQDDFETALKWINEGRVDLTKWIEEMPLEEGGLAFEKLIAGPGNVAKIILHI